MSATSKPSGWKGFEPSESDTMQARIEAFGNHIIFGLDAGYIILGEDLDTGGMIAISRDGRVVDVPDEVAKWLHQKLNLEPVTIALVSDTRKKLNS